MLDAMGIFVAITFVGSFILQALRDIVKELRRENDLRQQRMDQGRCAVCQLSHFNPVHHDRRYPNAHPFEERKVTIS